MRGRRSKARCRYRHNRKREIAGLLKLLLKTVIRICSQDEGEGEAEQDVSGLPAQQKQKIAGLLKILLNRVILICAQDEGKEK